MTDRQCSIHAYVSGRVQGVFFRAFTREQAMKHKVNGWAKNLADGRVEVMLAGDVKNVERVISALNDGPQHAKVTFIEKETLPFQLFEGFITA